MCICHPGGVVVTFVVLLVSSGSTLAGDNADVQHFLNLGAGYQHLDFRSKQIGSDDIELPLLNLSMITKYDNWMLSAALSESVNGDKVDVGITFDNEKAQASYRNVELTAQYLFESGFNVFVGYLDNNYKFEFSKFFEIVALPGVYRTDYQENGPFIGIGYSQRVGRGRLGVKLAYADMDGQFDDNQHPRFGARLDDRGYTTGYSISGSWTGMINSHWLYRLSLAFRRYEYNGHIRQGLETSLIPEGAPEITVDAFDSKWDSEILGLSVIYKF